MLLLIKAGCYLGLLPGREGRGVWEGGFVEGFFAGIWEIGTEMVGQMHRVYIHRFCLSIFQDGDIMPNNV